MISSTRTLSGKTVAITRPKHQCGEMIELIKSLGGVTFNAPMVETIPMGDLLESFIMEIISGQYDLLIFLSTNSVGCLFGQAQKSELLDSLRDSINTTRVVAIGARTLEELHAYGVTCAVVADTWTTEGVLENLGEDLLGLRVGVPRSSKADDELKRVLEERGAVVREVTAYVSRLPEDRTQTMDLFDCLEAGLIHAVTFTSASTARNMFTVAEEYSRVEGLRRDLSKVAVAAIGPKTAETLTTLGVTVNVIPTTYSVEGLVYALVDELCRRN